MGCEGMGPTAVHYNQMNLYHSRENNARCIVTVGIDFLAAYSKKNICRIIKTQFLFPELFLLVFFLLG